MRSSSTKLTSYNLVKKSTSIGFEPFLNLSDSGERKCLLRLRSSSHRINRETASYVTNDDLRRNWWTPLWTRRCTFCTTEAALPFTYLPFGSIIEEDEHHVLISCPRYHEYRLNLQMDTKYLLRRNERHHELYHWNRVKHLAQKVKKISHRLRKTSKTTKKQNRTNTSDQDKDNGKPNS